ncbi:hypothetical protein C8N24_0682 [Solirubrobacter pauli]|uniref:Uncharacterized protein n=1 Tax=Solirubrobacter pauli TaxID=166793 RepID=A0A660L756_9ACTN|nr:hypothetical protein [Solirubrobacter pauli]RKQ90867.1 hypothetical protein C8N24_0682 [Solirubrobacter pauli]
MHPPLRFRPPTAAAVPLPGLPPKTTFGGPASPEGRRISAYTQQIAPLLAPWRGADGPPLGLALEIGLPAGTDPLVQHDLDNFLEPLATELASPRLCFVRATKTVGGPSRLTIGPVEPGEPDHIAPHRACGRCERVSAPGRRVLGRTVAAQAAPLPWGPVALDLALRVDTSRNWVGAWKPVIDSLVAILGRRPNASEFDIEDGRIVELTLHRELDGALGHAVEVDARWRLLEPRPGGPQLTYDVLDAPPAAARTPGSHAATGPAVASRAIDDLEPIVTVDRLHAIQAARDGYVVITDSANSPRLHRAGCPGIQEANFVTKVITNGARNGTYLWTARPETARERWARLREHDCVNQ